MRDTAITRLDHTLFARLGEEARQSPRRRTHFNLHHGFDEPVQRFLNVIEPGTYIPPHRHVSPPKWEFTLVVRGRAAVLIFDETGTVLARHVLSAGGPLHGVELTAGTWHTLVAEESDTVVLEIKEGPFTGSHVEKEFATWAPAEGEAGCTAMVNWLGAAREGERFAPLGEQGPA